MKAIHFLSPNSPKPTITNLKTQSLSTITQTQIVFHSSKRSLTISCSNGADNGNNDEMAQPQPSRVVTEPSEGMEIRFRRGTRKRMRQDGLGETRTMAMDSSGVKKKWEEMTMMEKAMEIYVGEKGMLFWLNKFAYASIFIVIGGWILFRFVGPSLNLYQLDTPPLAPTNMLKG